MKLSEGGDTDKTGFTPSCVTLTVCCGPPSTRLFTRIVAVRTEAVGLEEAMTIIAPSFVPLKAENPNHAASVVTSHPALELILSGFCSPEEIMLSEGTDTVSVTSMVFVYIYATRINKE